MESISLLDGAYHSAVHSGLMLANSMIAEKVFKVKPLTLGKIDVRDTGMLLLNVYMYTAEMTRSWLVKQKILPDSVVPVTPVQ